MEDQKNCVPDIRPDIKPDIKDESYSWIIEFNQNYADGFIVEKRGLDATPLVLKKYNIASKEVMTFSNHQKRNTAISVFHFHPDFPAEGRVEYMESHKEGYEVALETAMERRTERREYQAEWAAWLKHTGRSISLSLHAIILFVMAHHSGPR